MKTQASGELKKQVGQNLQEDEVATLEDCEREQHRIFGHTKNRGSYASSYQEHW